MSAPPRVWLVATLLFPALAGCGCGGPSGPGASHGAPAGNPSGVSDSGASPFDAGPGATPLEASVAEGGIDAGSAADAGAPTDMIQRLLALTTSCNVASTGQYAFDPGYPPSVDVCKLNGAYFWYADMDVDCDGQSTTECNATTDPQYQSMTSFNQSNGQPLNAAQLPYVVVPLPSPLFDYTAAGIQPGAVVAVIYNGLMTFGIFGDEGPPTIIGEASYAMVQSLGVDPDPANGGITGMAGVTYIVFTGTSAVAAPMEDHSAAVALGQQLAMQLLQTN